MEGNTALHGASSVRNPHVFHIPVMGTGFTIDTPLKVARYGISSAISLLDDVLIEQMRRYHCRQNGEPYTEITRGEEDARARRITAYLNLLNRLVKRQSAALQASPFEPGSEITKYYEMLPNGELRRDYERMLSGEDEGGNLALQAGLRRRAVPGSIDANIMTKADADKYVDGVKQPPGTSDAMAALRGFAMSDIEGAVIFSAGMNPRLYGYAATFPDFLPGEDGRLKKRIILKVSDYRSAEVQGRFLAKRGLWVSEFRVESGLNCGGHAFAAKGNLLGPVLMEFKLRRRELEETLYGMYTAALAVQDNPYCNVFQPLRITVQGGIGTAEEQEHLLKHYGVDGTGWGTPFMLVPEVTNLDTEHLQKLAAATSRDVYLSDSSPLGVPFWNLRTSASELERRRRITAGQPGSPCIKGYAELNTEHGPVPMCAASRSFQRLKLAEIKNSTVSARRKRILQRQVIAKSCICHDLAGNATKKYGIDPGATSSVCCGPGIINFSRIATLDEMVGHIYGRLSLLNSTPRLNMFYRELLLNVAVYQQDVQKLASGLADFQPRQLINIREALIKQVAFYTRYLKERVGEQKVQYYRNLAAVGRKLEHIPLEAAIKAFTRRNRLAGQPR